MSWTQMLENRRHQFLCTDYVMHAYNVIVYGNHWTDSAAFPFYVWATDQAICPREPSFWHPCSELQRSPSDEQGELTAILWKLK